MDINALSSLYTQSNNVGLGIMVLKKAMTQTEGTAELLQGMMNQITQATTAEMERSVTPHLGANIDIRV